MNYVRAIEFLTLLVLVFREKMIKEAELKESGKLDEIQASIDILMKSRDPKERKDAAIALGKARR